MKRSWILTTLAFIGALLLFGCTKSGDEGKTTPGTPANAPPIAAKAPMPQEFSATMVSTSAGQTVTTMIYMKGDKFRTDTKNAGSVTIVRKDLNKVWMLMPAQKTYMEVGGVTDEQVSMAEEKVKGEVSRKEVGSETINGHPATKYEVTAKVDGNSMQIHQWWATDINFPVKTAAVDGSWSMEYRDVKIGGQADSLFEIPAGYNKMAMPAMPKGMNINVPGIK